MITVTMGKMLRVLDTAGISPTLFAKVVDIPGTSLREAARGVSYLGSELEANLYAVACRLRDIVVAIAPITCDDPEALKKLLEHDVAELREWRERVLP